MNDPFKPSPVIPAYVWGPGVERRAFLGGVGAMAVGGLGWLSSRDRRTVKPRITGPAASDPTRDPTRARVDLDLAAGASEWSVDPRVFGKFIEHNGRDVYPGFESDHLSNGSFERWNRTGHRTSLLFDVEAVDGIAYGWEPVVESGRVSFEHVAGGVNGRRATPDLDRGPEVPFWIRPNPIGVVGPRFQRVVLDGRGGVRQRTAIPDGRTRRFDLELSVRGAGVSRCEVALTGPNGESLAADSVPVDGEWTRHTVPLSLDARSDQRYRGSTFGTYALELVGAGQGHLDLDWAVLRSGDAVAGRFNPTTIDNLRTFNVTSLRWPGGNFASQYHWRDGVGPLVDRPVVPNLNWGGLERNSFGTDEFLAFCRLADVEPLITVGSWSGIGPAEAAAWVEYVNGDRSTEFGALRAANGHPKPWGVEAWQVGNEVWGLYQVGNQSARRYARRFAAYREAMLAADPSITVDATGIDPGWTDQGDGTVAGRGLGEPPTWNDRVLGTVGSVVGGLDLHRYTAGIQTEAGRRLWCLLNGADPVGYNQALVNSPTPFGRHLTGLVEAAAARDVADLRVVVGEWNLQPKVDRGWPRAGYRTAAHAAYVGSMLATFLRHGGAVRQAHQRDNTLYFRPYPRDLRPINPGNYVQRFVAEPFLEGDAAWRVLPVTVAGATFTLPQTGFRLQRTTDVPYLDIVAARADDGRAVVVAVNRNLRHACRVRLAVVGWPEPRPAAVPLVRLAGRNDDPFARQDDWSAVDGFTLTETTLTPTEAGELVLELPPASVARVTVAGTGVAGGGAAPIAGGGAGADAATT